MFKLQQSGVETEMGRQHSGAEEKPYSMATWSTDKNENQTKPNVFLHYYLASLIWRIVCPQAGHFISMSLYLWLENEDAL